MQNRNPESPIIGIFPKVTQKEFTVQRCPSVFTHTVHTLLWLLYDKSLHHWLPLACLKFLRWVFLIFVLIGQVGCLANQTR